MKIGIIPWQIQALKPLAPVFYKQIVCICPAQRLDQQNWKCGKDIIGTMVEYERMESNISQPKLRILRL
jgi:hypothetical protein